MFENIKFKCNNCKLPCNFLIQFFVFFIRKVFSVSIMKVEEERREIAQVNAQTCLIFNEIITYRS